MTRVADKRSKPSTDTSINPSIVVEDEGDLLRSQLDRDGARQGDHPKHGRYLEIFAIVVGFETLLIALAVVVGWLQDGMSLRQILPALTLQSLAMLLAAMTVVSVCLFGVLSVQHIRTLQNRTRQRDDAYHALEQSESRLRLAQSAAGIATIDWDIAGDKAVWNANFFKVFGVKDLSIEQKSPYEHLIDIIHPDDRDRMDAMHLALFKTGGAYSDEFRIQRPDGEIRWIAARGEVYCDGNGVPRRLVGANIDITERRRTEEALRDSLNIIEFANDAGEIGVWNNDFASATASCDDRTRSIFGFAESVAAINAEAFYAKLHASDRLRVKTRLTEAVKSGGKFALECRIQNHDEKLKWVRIRGMAEMDAMTGRAVRMTGIVFDITDRREREQHLRFLVRELTHRSKNLLAVIQAMARQAGTTAASLEEFQFRFAGRLQGLSASHDLLVNEDWHGAFIHDVVQSQVRPFADQIGLRVQIDGAPLLLKPEAAQNIGMAVHELATNAAKYGALSNDVGKINVSWRVHGVGDAARLNMKWQESGGPPVLAPAQRGFGSVVTERVVARALEADVKVAYATEGLTWALDSPASVVLTFPRSPAQGGNV